jgi:hypothetical protein
MKILSALKQEEKIVITSGNRQEDVWVLVLSYLVSSKKKEIFLKLKDGDDPVILLISNQQLV